MKIVVYEDRSKKSKIINKNLKIIFNSLKDKYPNYEVIYVNHNNFKLIECDYAIIWNVYCKFKSNTINRKIIKEHQEKTNNKLIVIELGFMQRKDYFSIGFDNISNFGKYPQFPINDDRLNKLNLKINNINYDNTNKNILFCTQVPWDTQVQDIDYDNWIIKSINLIQKYSKKKIVVRVHPKHKKRNSFQLYNSAFFKANNLDVTISNKSLKHDLNNSYCVVAYNSTVLVDAVIDGKPILSGSKTSIVSDIAVYDFSKVDNLPRFTDDQIRKCLSQIAFKQWNSTEITNGEPFEYYIN